MAGRIREESIAEVREKASIEEVVGQYVTLKNAGAGSRKGLCPFHDEKTPSFNVNASRQSFHCFGCGEGGDVISFVMKIDGLSFMETVERLAEKYGVELKREDGEGFDDRPKGPARGKMVEAHRVAQEFYAEHLLTPEAAVARQFLTERGFDGASAEQFGLGFAPRGGDDLFKHLRARGFTSEEITVGGLAVPSQRGGSPYDRFRGRLLWPIREASGETIGFGARRIFEDDRVEAKYLNTSETPIYKKSKVLYGIDLARREMGRSSQAVVVEGYTDVMACHLAGVGTAVASCGTAFGDDHAKVLRRYMADHEEFRGEVIFTFDGDAAGQAAALKAFQGDQNFVSQTYVAVEPDGLDPCDLRIKKGDAAVRELVARRVPLYRFVLRNLVEKYDLDRADGRVGAAREAMQLVFSSRDQAAARSSYAREIAQLTGLDPLEVQAQMDQFVRRGRSSSGAPQAAPEPPARRAAPSLLDPRFLIERETLKLVVQHPTAIGRSTAEIGPDDFTHPAYRAVWEVVSAAGGPSAGAGDAGWVARLRDAAAPDVVPVLNQLSVEPLKRQPTGDYIAEHVFRLLELTAQRRIAEVKARLQRTNPVEHAEAFNRMFGELAALEEHRRKLRDHIIGAQ
ncbi:DNA primase [Nocardioides anomalus]|uniref:DNA primase n=1 Tax=Nocardioides anomalus TaxID=2712223 RepID=A0A6G6WC86_9ACTN|nr:DNA primase [Nocardioides anomalus]QIG42767.1 DNA primase [Nocardioides anomalus]